MWSNEKIEQTRQELYKKVCDSCDLLSGCTTGPMYACAKRLISEQEQIIKDSEKIIERQAEEIREVEEDLAEKKNAWSIRATTLQKKINELEAELKELKTKGKSTGGRVPFGYKCLDGTNLVEDEEQQQIIKSMKHMRKKNFSYREISRRIKQFHKIEISHSGIRKILNRDPEPKTKFVF